MTSEPGALGQVLINLINNAYLHAFEGRSNGVLTISAHVCGSEVELTVADNGIGMPADRLDKLFQPFFSTKIGQGGTGLGMLIVQNLLTKNLGGRIAVQSAEGLGTLFRCTIPLSAPESAPHLSP
jgi:signal transduction histidine kinase